MTIVIVVCCCCAFSYALMQALPSLAVFVFVAALIATAVFHFNVETGIDRAIIELWSVIAGVEPGASLDQGCADSFLEIVIPLVLLLIDLFIVFIPMILCITLGLAAAVIGVFVFLFTGKGDVLSGGLGAFLIGLGLAVFVGLTFRISAMLSAC
ncbi:MAG: hypothetical protein WD846_04080 [Patescibacteria group bacterium]